MATKTRPSTDIRGLLVDRRFCRTPVARAVPTTKLAPARTKLQLVKAASQHLRSVQRRPKRIKSYFEHGPVRYAA